jgi:hypothetical protein
MVLHQHPAHDTDDERDHKPNHHQECGLSSGEAPRLALDGYSLRGSMRQGACLIWTSLVIWYPAGLPQVGTL